jgi:hypothetical protein
MKVKLLEKPDGYTSRYYAVTVGKVYTVIDKRGSCFVIFDDQGEEATIANCRFEVAEHEQA